MLKTIARKSQLLHRSMNALPQRIPELEELSIYQHIQCIPYTGALGAEVHGIDLSLPIDDGIQQEMLHAFHEYGVLFFRNQGNINYDQHMELASLFGTPEPHPIVTGLPGYPDIVSIVKEANEETKFGETWHSDNSFMKKPSMGSILVAREVPPYGNDTMFSCMNLAYKSLSNGMQQVLKTMKAVHSAKEAFDDADGRADKFEGKREMKYERVESLKEENLHPVIRTHPITGQQILFVNKMFTLRFDGMTKEESKPMLDYLFQLPYRPEFQCRFRWAPGSIAIWDNRRVQHMAINDYNRSRRVMHRVTVQGEVPFFQE